MFSSNRTGHYRRSDAALLTAGLACVTLIALASPLVACNIPVYRYALERWKADKYPFFVLHSGAQDQQAGKLLRELQEYATDIDCPSNIDVQPIDVAKDVAEVFAGNVGLLAGTLGVGDCASFYPGRIDEGIIALLNMLPTEPSAAAPLLVIRYPFQYGLSHNLYAGPLDMAVVRGFLDSPIRQELAQRLMKGQTAVWLMVDSGDKAADDQAAASLHKTFDKLHKTLKLPTLTEAPDDQLLNPDGPKLRVEFTLLRVSRNDPKEAMLIETLLHLEEGLAELTEPIVFPIFGRGIALPAFAGKGITDAHEELHSTAAFLVGPCSCQVKAQNPGLDLLMTASWGPVEGPKLPGISEFLSAAMSQAAPVAPAEKELAPAADAVETSADPPTNRATPQLLRNAGIAIAIGLLVLAAFSLLIRVRNSRS